MAIPPLFSPPLAKEVGLAVDRANLSEEETGYSQSLEKAAEDAFLELYPIFKDPPHNIHTPSFPLTPFRLFRTLVPPKPEQTAQANILFLGNYATGQVQVNAEITSLWGVAYLEGLLPSSTKRLLQDEEQMNKDIAWNEAYKRKRYSNYMNYRLTPMETPEIIDQLMEDLGLRADRKRMRMPGGLGDLFGLRSWIAEWFHDYFTSAYEGVVQEFLDSIEKRGETTKHPNEPASLVDGIEKED
jgi:dimethylaniline monooxygenase (N-oxide forming)